MATKKEKEKNIELLARLERWWKLAEDNRADYDWKWFLYDLWVNGNHYAKWDRVTQTITTAKSSGVRPQIVINKVYQTLRSVRNFVLRNRPRAEVTPLNMSEENVNQVVKINKYLDYLHDKMRLRMKIKGSVWHALKYSVGFWRVMWDEEAQEVRIDLVDPFDFYPDPVAKEMDEIRYAFLAVVRNVDDIVHDPLYADYIKKEDIELVGDNKKAASNLKERLLNYEKKFEAGENKKDKVHTSIVKECYYKEFDEKEKQWNWYIATTCEGKLIRPPEKTDLDRIPFFKLQSDIEPLKFYGQGWVKNLIPVNKLLNKLQSQLAEYNDLMNRGKWIMDKGAGVRTINNENGQIIEKKRGFDLTHVPPASLSGAIYRQIEDAERYIEDLGGAHDASMGRIPTGAKSGKALEALQVGDANNMSEVIENLENFLEDVYEYVLKLVANKYQFVRNVIPMSMSTGERDFIKVIGANADNIPEDATVIQPENAVDVSITSWLAETQEARRETLKELYELQVVDQETVLKGYEIGNVAEIMQQTKLAKEEARQQEMEQQLTLADAQNQNNAQEPPAQAGPMQANADLQRLLSGQEVKPSGDVGPDYLAYLDQFMSSPEFQELEPQIQALVADYRAQVVSVMR